MGTDKIFSPVIFATMNDLQNITIFVYSKAAKKLPL